LRKFKVTVVPEINQIQFACTGAAPPIPYSFATTSPAPFLLSVASSSPPLLPVPTPEPAPVPAKLPAAATSSQPPTISAHVVQNPEVKSPSFSSRENQSLLDPPPSYKIIIKYPILSLLMLKICCKNSPLFYAPGM
jgi:hypothetical protein